MAIENDVSIDYNLKQIDVSNNSYTVRQLYSYLMDVFDDPSQMDDDVPMSAQTPTVYTLINSWTLTETSTNYLSGGSIISEDGNNLWSNLYTIGSIEDGTNLYIVQNGEKISSWWSEGHIDILVKVKENSSFINDGKVTVFAREYGDVYDHYEINLSGGGRNPVPLQTSNDIDNNTLSTTVSGYGISLNFSSIIRNLNNGGGDRSYDVEIDCAGKTLSETYEYLKYITRRDSTTQLNSVDGEKYISANDSYSTVKASPLGTFAGGKFFGAQGVWLTNYDASDAKNFQLIDSAGVIQNPPNVVGVTVSSVLAGDNVAVFPLTEAGGEINKSQYHLDGNHSIGVSQVLIKENISPDTPFSGSIRISGDRFEYSSWSGKTFTLKTSTTKIYNDNDNIYIPIIDNIATGASVNNTLTYSSVIPVVVKVRKKGILPFEVETSIGSTGMSVAAIRTIDGVVT